MKELQFSSGRSGLRGSMPETVQLDGSTCALIEEISRMLHRLRTRVESGADYGALAPDPISAIGNVRSTIQMRTKRRKLFRRDLFADPGWDILLHLYRSHLEQRRETITGIICLAELPPTTGLRWVHKLVEEQLLTLRDDPLDQRRRFVSLSPIAVSAMEAFFDTDVADKAP